MSAVDIAEFVANIGASALAPWAALAPWELTSQSQVIVRRLITSVPAAEFSSSGEVWVHRSAVVESGAVLKGPLILGPRCFVAAGAYLRDGGGCTHRGDGRLGVRPTPPPRGAFGTV